MTTQSLTPGLHPERLKHIRASYEASKQGHAFIGHPSYDEQITIIDALLAAYEQKPVLNVQFKNGWPVDGTTGIISGSPAFPDGFHDFYPAPSIPAKCEQEPVAWLIEGGGAPKRVTLNSVLANADPLSEATPLYAAPVVREGYALVPKKETLVMAVAGGEVYAQCESVGEHPTDAARQIWREMLEVAAREAK